MRKPQNEYIYGREPGHSGLAPCFIQKMNVYNNNTTPIRRDEELVAWFMEEYRWLLDDPSVEVLYEITDFGVG